MTPYFPKISVIIGVLNMKHYLASTLNSVRAQNYPNVELIIMDGGSTDGTIDIIKQYEKHIFSWKSEKDRGHCDACNKAIDIATGDLLFLLNADDIIGDNLFYKVAQLYNENPKTKMITCGVRIVEKTSTGEERIIKTITSPEQLQLSLQNVLFGLPVINARFFSPSIFKEFGKFKPTHPDGSYNLSNDREFLIKLVLAGVKSSVIPEALYFYLSHSDSLTFSQKNIIKSHSEHLILAEYFLKMTTLTSSQRKLLTKWQARESAYLFLIFLLQKKFYASIKMARYGIVHVPIQWPVQISSILYSGVLKKLKKLFPTKATTRSFSS